jgi:amino acid transporter
MPRTQSTHAIGFSRILGLRDSVALGLSLGIPLVIVVLHEAVFAVAGSATPVVYFLATLLYVPLILSYMELAAGRPGSSSPYQIAGSFLSSGLSFTVGWLMLAGLVAVATLLAVATAESIEVWLADLFEIDIGDVWVVAVVVLLAAANEWLSDVDRWRMRTAMVGIALALIAGAVIWGYVSHPPGGELREADLAGHGMTGVALLAAGLWSIDLLSNHRRQMRRPDATLRSASLLVWLVSGVLGVASTALAVRSPDIWLANWSEKLSWGETRLELLILIAFTALCWVGLSRVV